MRKRVHSMKKLFLLCLIITILPLHGTVYGEEELTIPEEHQLERLVDGADLLDSNEEASLVKMLDEISERQQCDVAVVTVDGLKGKTPQAYADDFYDYNGYGMGADDDGMLLLVSMEDRDWYITTYSFGETALTDAGIEYISEKFLPDLSDGDYADAFMIYAKLCDQFITQAKEGKPYDIGNMPKEKMSLIWIPISIAIGFVLALIVTGVMRLQLKTVRRQAAAASYIKPGSRNITISRDIFLYRNVIRTKRPENNGGGSSTHTSSSGRSHGGGGGKF